MVHKQENKKEINITGLEIGPGDIPVDKNWHHIDCIKRNLPRFKLCKWGFEKLPFNDRKFDIVYASHVLEHVPWYKVNYAIDEVYRVLNINGRFEVHVPDFTKILISYTRRNIPQQDKWRRFNPENSFFKWINGRIFSYGENKENKRTDENFHRCIFDFDSLLTLLTESGFYDIISVEPRKDNHGYINLGLSGTKK